MAKNDEKDKDQAQDAPTTLTEQVERDTGNDGPVESVSVTGSDLPSTGSAAAPPTIDESTYFQGDEAEKQAELAERAREVEAEMIDPVTNQRAGDFFPQADELDERTQELVLNERQATGVGARVQALSNVRRTRRNQAAQDERAEANVKAVDKAYPLPKQEMVALDPATYKARAMARVQAKARSLTTNRTIPGGKFVVAGVLVNAAGDRIDEDGNVIEKRSL